MLKVGRTTIWLKWTFKTAGIFALGPLGDLFDQQVVAFDFYTADTPTWDNCSGQVINIDPPETEQARLGGCIAYEEATPAVAIAGRSAIALLCKYRVLQIGGHWVISAINYYDLPWWQWVAFAEGRVADEVRYQNCIRIMKWNLSGAVRFQVEGIVVRAELARGGDEGIF